ncbi:hypothetical protein KC730_00950, partial [Candidatus Kaiserbacteria bacterium]|nr:hypothetical protein [Candidatus Kaiserbacteria bacterium]
MNNKLKKILPYTLAIFFLVLGMLSFGSSIEAQAKPPMLEVTQVIGPGNLNTITYKNVSASSILDIHERYDANFSNGFYCVSNCGYVDVLWPGEEFTITYNYDCPLGVCPVGPVTSTFEASPFGISVDDVAAYEVVVLVTLEAPVLTPVPPPTTAPAISITPFPVHVFDDVLADAGQTVDVKMTVTNIGDGAPLMGSITELTDYIGCVGVCEFSLGVGASSDFTITFAPEAGARPYANWIIVTSNAGDTATLFGGVGVKPNLTTDSIVITSGNEVEVGETIDFEATFTNVGQFDVDGAFKNHLSYRFGNSGNFTDMTGGRTTYEGVINQGESLSDQVSLLIPMTSPSPGNLWIRHCIDFDNNIDESNESDNCFETDFGPVIPQNDLAASTGSGNPVPNSITGVYDSISVLMNIHNFGNDLPSADPTVSGV